jgi:hypothetical protein
MEEVIHMVKTDLLARTPEQIRTEARRALAVHREATDRAAHYRLRGEEWRAVMYENQASRIRAHVTAYTWLLGETDVAPVTGRRVPARTTRDLWIEQCPGRDHAEQNTHRVNDPERLFPEAVFDAIAWARGEFDQPPSGE